MTSLADTIIAKSDQLNADDLIGKSITIKIMKVSGKQGDQPIAVNYEGDQGKPYLPCKSMRRVLVYCWGEKGTEYVGRYLTLYRDPSVKFGGLEVGGIRISHMSHIKESITMALTASKANKKAFTVKPLEIPATATVNPDEITALKNTGTVEAGKGKDALKAWWGSVGGVKQNQLGVAFLDELKGIAGKVAPNG